MSFWAALSSSLCLTISGDFMKEKQELCDHPERSRSGLSRNLWGEEKNISDRGNFATYLSKREGKIDLKAGERLCCYCCEGKIGRNFTMK